MCSAKKTPTIAQTTEATIPIRCHPMRRKLVTPLCPRCGKAHTQSRGSAWGE